MNKQSQPIEIFTVPESAHILRVSQPTIRKLIRTGKLSATRIGTQWRVNASDVRALLPQPAQLAAINKRTESEWAAYMQGVSAGVTQEISGKPIKSTQLVEVEIKDECTTCGTGYVQEAEDYPETCWDCDGTRKYNVPATISQVEKSHGSGRMTYNGVSYRRRSFTPISECLTDPKYAGRLFMGSEGYMVEYSLETQEERDRDASDEY